MSGGAILLIGIRVLLALLVLSCVGTGFGRRDFLGPLLMAGILGFILFNSFSVSIQQLNLRQAELQREVLAKGPREKFNLEKNRQQNDDPNDLLDLPKLISGIWDVVTFKNGEHLADFWVRDPESQAFHILKTKMTLNLRKEPSTSSSVVVVMPKDSEVETPLGQNVREKNWIYVDYKKDGRVYSGWAHLHYLRLSTEAEEEGRMAKAKAFAMDFVFPEKTLKGKIVGWSIGFIIGLGLSMILNIGGMIQNLAEWFRQFQKFQFMADEMMLEFLICTGVPMFYYGYTRIEIWANVTNTEWAMYAIGLLGLVLVNEIAIFTITRSFSGLHNYVRLLFR